MPVVATGLAGGLDDRLGPLRERLREQGQEGEREVLALEERRRGQDVVGVAGGVGDVEVDRDHQVEFAQRGRQLLAIRHR